MIGSRAQLPFQARLEGFPGEHYLFWPSKANYRYHIQMSTDLGQWTNTGPAVLGDGTPKDLGFTNPDVRLFYRVYETGFLLQPTPSQRVDLIDGVCFAFNLNFFPQLPGKIRLYRRPWNNGAAWLQIGCITDFVQIDGIRTVRGSAVWVPDENMQGEYEVKAEVVNTTGTVIGTEQRHVIVGANEPPTVKITGFDGTPSFGKLIRFTTEVEDATDEIRRVEFYDNNVLVGVDTLGPDFGNQVSDLAGEFSRLYRGSHSFSAKAFDSRGAFASTVTPFILNLATGNAAPTVSNSGPSDGTVVQVGQSFSIQYTASDPDGMVASVRSVRVPQGSHQVTKLGANGPITYNTLGWVPGAYTFKLSATDSAASSETATSYAKYVTIFVSPGATQTFAAGLAGEIADEATAVPSNAKFIGVQASSDKFTLGTASGLQMSAGILLTTGMFTDWNGGDDDIAQDAISTIWYEAGDSVLEDRVAGVITRDAAGLEFDLFCSHSQLEIEFQFGSEEYDEYVSQYNDGFMISVDGVIVSLLPDCSDIVAVQSIHQAYATEGTTALNEFLFLDDDTDINTLCTNQPKQVEYDGMTIRLRAHVFVTPNETHEIRLVVADVRDYQLDSGLFIKQSSLRTIVPQP
jgi:hypothetical protein